MSEQEPCFAGLLEFFVHICTHNFHYSFIGNNTKKAAPSNTKQKPWLSQPLSFSQPRPFVPKSLQVRRVRQARKMIPARLRLLWNDGPRKDLPTTTTKHIKLWNAMLPLLHQGDLPAAWITTNTTTANLRPNAPLKRVLPLPDSNSCKELTLAVPMLLQLVLPDCYPAGRKPTTETCILHIYTIN